MYSPEDQFLIRLADRLDAWADESETGGWSTHQVQPQRLLAMKIRNAIITGGYVDVCPSRDREA